MKKIPIDTRALFAPLHKKLLQLLASLSEADWERQTVAKKWKVKDVVSHLLDTQLRVLSMQRDRYFGEQPPDTDGYGDQVGWINQLNQDWVLATKRLSPEVLKLLLETIGEPVNAYYATLDPWEEAIFPVAWAGESVSYNWMHLAREYTEYWHHQQQIRDAVGIPGIITRELLYPVLDTFFQALPHTFKDVDAEVDTLITASITSDAGGTWYLRRAVLGWQLEGETESAPTASITLPVDVSWPLFTKSIRPKEILDKVVIQGDEQLASKVLEMVAVMA